MFIKSLDGFIRPNHLKPKNQVKAAGTHIHVFPKAL
jgi:hypothetical protein